MKITLAEPRLLKDPISIISELVTEVTIKIDTDKLEIIAMDPATVAMVVFKLLSSSFIDYEIDKPQQISLNLDNLKQILRRAKPSDTLILEVLDSKLKIDLKSDTSRSFELSLINLDEEEQKVPNLTFNTRIELPTTLFDEAVEDMDVVAEAVSFSAETSKFEIAATGNLSSAKVSFKSDDDVKIETQDQKISSKYSLEYLKKIIKGSKLSNKVIIQFGEDYPLRIDYIVMDKLSLSTILAPRAKTNE
ncbi:proliferating cell nuclear antigen (pcna) [archaeon]|nr:proliferating cell nuclear antigen (pcna) [archaeon]